MYNQVGRHLIWRHCSHSIWPRYIPRRMNLATQHQPAVLHLATNELAYNHNRCLSMQVLHEWKLNKSRDTILNIEKNLPARTLQEHELRK